MHGLPTVGALRRVPATLAGAGAVAMGYRLVISGALTLDLGWGRSRRPLGPLRVDIAAPRETVFEVIAAPYSERTTRAMAEKVRVLERGTDMVLATHYTRLGRNLVAATVETVRFHHPDLVAFRLVRGPVPDVAETFELHEHDGITQLDYAGELASDFWAAGRWWGQAVAARWVDTVRASLVGVKAESERRAQRAGRGRKAEQR